MIVHQDSLLKLRHAVQSRKWANGKDSLNEPKINREMVFLCKSVVVYSEVSL